MMSSHQIQLQNELFKWILIALAGIGLAMLLISHGEEVWEYFSGLFTIDPKPDRYAIEDPRAKQSPEHRRRVKKWTKEIKRRNRWRVKRELYYLDWRSRRKAIDSVANTLATHEEILKTMYKKAGWINKATGQKSNRGSTNSYDRYSR